MKQRVLYLDAIRDLACLMVVLVHSPQPDSAGGYVLSSISFFTTPCIGLFFMISGALLLPVQESTEQFIKQRLVKILIPTILWSMLYLLVEFLLTGDFGSLLKSMVSMPFSVQGCGIYWFIYVLVGLYLLAPILSRWLQKASIREMKFYLLLWLITMSYPILRHLLYINDGKTGILYYFGGYAGYFVLGYYLHNYAGRWRNWVSALLSAWPVGCAVMCKLANFHVDFYDMFFYLSLSAASMCTGVFMWIKERFKDKQPSAALAAILTDFSNCSFGIYLVHFMVIRNLLWKFDLLMRIPFGGGIVIIFILGTAISWGMVHLISLVPKSEYVIGFRRR